MPYEVVIERPAREDIETAYLWLYQSVGAKALNWFYGIEDAILSLEQFPKRCGFAPENQWLTEEIRQLLYGRKKSMYRILFTIQEERVHVLHVRHTSQDLLDPKGFT